MQKLRRRGARLIFLSRAELMLSRRFIEVLGFSISDSRRASKFKVVIRHAASSGDGDEKGAEETFVSEGKASEVTIPCETYVEVSCTFRRS